MRTHPVKSRITMIEDGDGNVVKDPEKIKLVVVEFYKDLFTKHIEEIKDVVKSIKKEKAPGPDGYPIEFYKDTWEITKESVFEAVKTCFCTSNMPKCFNSISLYIIPKVKNPQNMKQFRPIACYNTIYKIIFTIIVGRLKKVLDYVIGIQHTTYVLENYSTNS
ncbi:hypothetical protein LIER_04849 [Lithospermum erythrorhizon]|uniref:Reverse transcriptase n=1 Tax=Lithospermum erythrorhizon TaxID=34254 RepID=A0AAV3NY80_LITER